MSLGRWSLWRHYSPPPLPSHVVTRWGRQEGHNLVVSGDQITRPHRPSFPVSYSLPPLHAKRASAFSTCPHLHFYSSIYRYTVLRYTILSVWTGIYTIISLSIDQESHFWICVIFRLLICVLFVFGNRLLKKTHPHIHVHALANPANF